MSPKKMQSANGGWPLKPYPPFILSQKALGIVVALDTPIFKRPGHGGVSSRVAIDFGDAGDQTIAAQAREAVLA